MDKKLSLVVFVGVILVALSFVIGYSLKSKPQQTTFGSTTAGNIVSDYTQTTYSSSTTLPVRLLDSNPNRISALIVNNSDTDVYLYFGYFASATAASTTVIPSNSFRLNAGGSSFEINDSNQYIGQVWMATTTAGKSINVLDK